MKIVQNVLFRQYGGRFSQISFLNVLNPKKRFTRLKFTPIRENCRLCMKIVQNVLLRPCGRRFDQITFFNVSEPKIALRDRNSRQYVKTVGFQGKLYKTCFSCNAKDVLTKSHFSTFRSQKSLYRTEIRENSRLAMKLVQNALFRSCAARFGQIAFWSVNFSKSSHWPEILAKTRKQCAFHENCTKGSFQVMLSTFWPNRISERRNSQNRHAGLKFSPKRENSAPSMKIVQNAFFRSCAALFGQIAFLSVKLLKIITLA